MNKLLLSLTLSATVAGGVEAQVISFNHGGLSVIPSGGQAGVVLAPNWNNSSLTTGSGLLDNSGAATTLSYSLTTPSAWGSWSIGATPAQDSDGSYNKVMLNEYYNSASAYSNPETLSLSSVPYSQYSLYVYFSSDTAGRTGTIALGSTTYSFSTEGPAATSGGNALFAQTTDTGTGNPTANYAVFSGLTGGSQTVSLDIGTGGGITGFQVVGVPEPSTAALAGLGTVGLAIWRRRLMKF